MSRTGLRVLRRHAGGAIEVVGQDGAGGRFTAWPGELPPERPLHPGLARSRQTLEIGGRPFWLEDRPNGALLSELQGLAAPEVAKLLLDVAEALIELQARGLSHGSVDAEHVVVDPSGHAVLIGACRSLGTPDADARDLRMLMASLWPLNASAPPDPGQEPMDVLAESLAGWIAYEAPDHSCMTLGRRSVAAVPTAMEQGTRLEETFTGQVDEVELDLGPEASAPGLMDFWHGRTGSSTGTHTRTREWTADGRTEAGVLVSSAPVALFARLMSPPEQPPDPQRFEGLEGKPSQAIKQLIADESLDPLPLPVGVRATPTEIDEPALDSDATLPWSADELPTQLTPAAELVQAEAPSAPGRRRWSPTIFILVALVVGAVVMTVWLS